MTSPVPRNIFSGAVQKLQLSLSICSNGLHFDPLLKKIGVLLQIVFVIVEGKSLHHNPRQPLVKTRITDGLFIDKFYLRSIHWYYYTFTNWLPSLICCCGVVSLTSLGVKSYTTKLGFQNWYDHRSQPVCSKSKFSKVITLSSFKLQIGHSI